MSRIPLELVYYVLNYLEPPQYEALCACALVSRAWLSIARARLFADVQLYERRGEENQDHLVPRRNLQGFLQLLRSTSEISLAVKSLAVKCGTFRPSTPSYMVIIEVLEMLPNLQKLSLANMLLPQTFPNLSRGPPTFTPRELHLTKMQNDSTSEHVAAAFFEFLALFSGVQELHLEVYLLKSFRPELYESFLGSYRLPPLRLAPSSLRLDGFELDQSLFLHTLGAGSLPDTLRTFTVTTPTLLFIAPYFAPFLSRSSYAVETLTFNIIIMLGAYIRARYKGSHSDSITGVLGPPMRKLLSLRYVRILYPGLAYRNTWGPIELFAIIECMPPSVTELHLYSKRGALPLPLATLEQVPGKCGPLRKVYLHTPCVDEAMASLREHPGIHCVQWIPGDEYK